MDTLNDEVNSIPLASEYINKNIDKNITIILKSDYKNIIMFPMKFKIKFIHIYQ